MKIFAAIAAAAFLSFSPATSWAKDVEIVNIRVGQGDATLIQGPPDASGNRVNILFDAGDIADYDGGKVIAAVLAKRRVRSLDYVIVSHYDVDHIGGLVAGGVHGNSFLLGWNQTPGATGDDDGDGSDGWIGARFFRPDPDELGTGDDIPVRFFVDRGDTPLNDSQASEKYRHLAGAMGQRISLDTQAEVDDFAIDLGGGAKMTLLAANGYVRGRTAQVPAVTTENERSLSFVLSYGAFDYLISGDMIGRAAGAEDARVESAVGDAINALGVKIDVLHVDHHGANNGSDFDFLTKIKPTIAVISAGNGNTHEHPHKDALRRLAAAGVYRIIQTAWGTTEDVMPPEVRKVQAIYQGDIIITSDGRDYNVSTSRTFTSDENPLRR